jgi:hypothetical protein
MTDLKNLPLTRQGVRDLNAVGARPRREPSRRWICPPHLSDRFWERVNVYSDDRVLRCRACHEVIETAEGSR